MLDYSFESVPTVGRYVESRAFQKIIIGPFGSGKSSGCVQGLMRDANMQRPWPDGVIRCRTAVVRNTYSELEDTTISTWMDWFPEGHWGTYKKSDHEYLMAWQQPGGQVVEYEVRFRALDRPDQVHKLLSAEYTNAWVNECREIPRQIWEALQGRVDRYPPKNMVPGGAYNPHVGGDTNPPDDDHWIVRQFEELLDPDGNPLDAEARAEQAIFRQPSGRAEDAENLPNLSKDYYRRLARGKGQDFIRVYVDGLNGYVQDGKPVYPEYNDSIHCREFEVAGHVPIDRGWDFGLTPACVFVQRMPNGQLRIFDEVVASRMGAKNLAKEVNRHTGEKYRDMGVGGDYADPAGDTPSESEEKSCYMSLNEESIYPIPGDQTLERRLESVRDRLTTMIDGEPGLLIHPRCQMLRKGFKGKYQFKRVKVSGERYRDKPDKDEYSHPHDALQYVCTRLFGRYQSNTSGENYADSVQVVI